MGIASARAKLLLFGEHSAVYGHPAVGCALPWLLEVEHEPGPWSFPGLGAHEAVVRTLVTRLESLAIEESLTAPTPGCLRISTGIPLGSGFGSSGALCAALVNLFWGDLSLADRDRLAWKAEAVFHGTPSGIDTALALREGWWSLDASIKPAAASRLDDPGFALVVGAVVRERNTKDLVGDLARRARAGDSAVLDGLAQLGRIAAEAVLALRERNAEPLAELVPRARKTLQSLDLETPALGSVLDAGLACTGALGAKLSGAGGGGAFFVLFKDKICAEKALSVVESAVPPTIWTAKPRLV